MPSNCTDPDNPSSNLRLRAAHLFGERSGEYGGFVAENILLGRLQVVQCADLAAIDEEDILLDVRTEAEYDAGSIPGGVGTR